MLIILQPKEIAYASRVSGPLLNSGRCWVMLIQIFLDALVKDAVRLKNEIDSIATRALAPCIAGNVMGSRFDLFPGICDPSA